MVGIAYTHITLRAKKPAENLSRVSRLPGVVYVHPSHITMKSLRSSLFTAALLLAAPAAFAQEGSDKTAAIDKAKAGYPLTTCVVSGEKLGGGDMGPPIDYIYKEDGKPDRLVRFCCKHCIPDFEKEPAKYLKQLDEAEAALAKASAAEPKR
jgi:hypothetical protein